jgi:hypothetical protein
VIFTRESNRSLLSTRPRAKSSSNEQIAGALFVVILIARLAGVYPPRESYIDDKAA